MKVLIIGSGISGIVSGIDVADAGNDVVIVEKNNYATGTLAKLERQFPNDACGMCQIYPFTGDDIPQYCLRRIFSHNNVEIRTNTEVVDVKGEGPFKVKFKKSPRGVIIERCISCRKCEEVCPVETEDEFNPIFGRRKAIYTDYPMPYPLSYSIDFKSCTKCKKCVEVCPTNAIDLEMKEEYYEMEFDRIIVTAGFEDINPFNLKEYGYKRFKNVITSIELERNMSFTGPNMGELFRPSDKKRPKNVAFIQCVGSRDKDNPFCSYACCMFALKEINLIKRFFPDINTSIFYMDMRTFGKGYYNYQINTKANFIKQRVASIDQDNEDNLIIKYEDNDGKLRTEKFELVVLSIGQRPNYQDFLIKDENGYPVCDFITSENKKGIVIAGSSSYPKDLMDSVIEAHSSVLEIVKESGGMKKEKYIIRKEDEKKIGLVLCDCFGLINYGGMDYKDVDILRMKDFCQNLEEVKNWINEKQINYILVSACSRYFLEPILKKFRINFDIADVREQFAFNNNDINGINFLINSRLNMIKEREINESIEIQINKDVAVIGGGLSGLMVADELSDAGLNVYLIEKTDKLGGNALKIKRHITGFDVNGLLNNLIDRIGKKENVKIIFNKELIEIRGSLGDFNVKLNDGNEIQAGFIVLATGANEYKPKEYGYGKNRNILTQIEFEDIIEKEDFNNKNIIMIQCVGSRNDEASFCSRVCCSRAVQNALRIKEKFKDANVYVLYRDMMTYGVKELYYKKARELGVVFLRFEEGKEPDVLLNDNIAVRFHDEILNDELEIKADYLILSTGIRNGNKEFYERIGIDTDENGFVNEANIKFKPLETRRPGIFVCGLAHSPRDTFESIKQARGVATQVLSIIKKGISSKNRISYTKERMCAGCGFCVDVCPYNARVIDEDRKVAMVYIHLCQGCGACISVCPSGAADMREMGYNEMFTGMKNL